LPLLAADLTLPGSGSPSPASDSGAVPPLLVKLCRRRMPAALADLDGVSKAPSPAALLVCIASGLRACAPSPLLPLDGVGESCPTP